MYVHVRICQQRRRVLNLILWVKEDDLICLHENMSVSPLAAQFASHILHNS